MERFQGWSEVDDGGEIRGGRGRANEGSERA